MAIYIYTQTCIAVFQARHNSQSNVEQGVGRADIHLAEDAGMLDNNNLKNAETYFANKWCILLSWEWQGNNFDAPESF